MKEKEGMTDNERGLKDLGNLFAVFPAFVFFLLHPHTHFLVFFFFLMTEMVFRIFLLSWLV